MRAHRPGLLPTLNRLYAGRRRPRLRGLLLPELAWLTAMAVAAAVFLLPGAVTGPRGAGAYRAGLALCPVKVGQVAFGAAEADASGVRTCAGGARYSLRWYQGYRGEHGSPAALRFSSAGAAHRWLRFLSGFDLEHEERYPFTYRESGGSSGIGKERKARRPRPLDGVADEAFIREVNGHRTGADGTVRLMEVTFRDSNVVVSVRAEPLDGPAAAVRAELTAMAGAVAAHLRARR
ncbi:hypothetical protein ETD83_37690 [Actinomadura soli]|uniref:DUF3558 domain-containing protein n=1 Tax=Actinomadura soli TaxID=2508997 RepID=A0A5C4J0R7_9ACTN|nr:hypothetical protein ETD83_37690 [Actinomadura soli]